MRLSTTYKLILLSTLCVVVSGCSHTFDENNNYVSKDVLHKMPMELMLVDRNDLADRGVSISVADNRPFKDTGSASEDSCNYEKACNLNSGLGCSSLGVLYYYGYGVKQDRSSEQANRIQALLGDKYQKTYGG